MHAEVLPHPRMQQDAAAQSAFFAQSLSSDAHSALLQAIQSALAPHEPAPVSAGGGALSWEAPPSPVELLPPPEPPLVPPHARTRTSGKSKDSFRRMRRRAGNVRASSPRPTNSAYGVGAERTSMTRVSWLARRTPRVRCADARRSLRRTPV
jgi:hypothetical protein